VRQHRVNAITAAQQGRHDSAQREARAALALAVDDAELLFLMAWTLHEGGQIEPAIETYHRLLSAHPDDVRGLNNLGNALKAAGRLEEAVEVYRRALELDSAHLNALQQLGTILLKLKRPDETEALLRRAVTLAPESASVHLILAHAISDLGRPAAALTVLERAITLEATNPEAHQLLGVVLSQLGRLGESLAAFSRAIELNPDCAEAYLGVANNSIVSNEAPFENLPELEHRAERLPEEHRGVLYFAIAKAYHDHGDPDAAFRCFLEANAHERRRATRAPGSYAKELTRIATHFPKALFEKLHGAGHDDNFPIFVVGMPRSGTTLVEQILASHPDVTGCGELTLLDEIVRGTGGSEGGSGGQSSSAGYGASISKLGEFPDCISRLTRPDCERIGRTYVDRLRTLAPSARRATDKMPTNFRYLGLLELALPRAPIVHCIRDPMDTCLSCFQKRFAENHEYAYDLTELGLYYQRYAELMAYWQRVLPERVLEIRYEALVAEPRKTIARLLAHCGLGWHDACLNFHENRRPVSTASASQVRQPLYTSSVGRWEHYRHHLAPLLAALGSYACDDDDERDQEPL
jgi:tetratricopeptide (TPR) repeat protein